MVSRRLLRRFAPRNNVSLSLRAERGNLIFFVFQIISVIKNIFVVIANEVKQSILLIFNKNMFIKLVVFI
jgi:hypothetical protein